MTLFKGEICCKHVLVAIFIILYQIYSPTSGYETAAYWNIKAIESFNRGDFNRSLFYISRALELSPYDPQILLNKAIILETLNRNNEALFFLNFILKSDPDNYKALLIKAGILIKQKNYDIVPFILNRVYMVKPYDPEILKLKGITYIATKHFSLAKKYLRLAKKYGGNITEIDNLLSEIPANLTEYSPEQNLDGECVNINTLPDFEGALIKPKFTGKAFKCRGDKIHLAYFFYPESQLSIAENIVLDVIEEEFEGYIHIERYCIPVNKRDVYLCEARYNTKSYVNASQIAEEFNIAATPAIVINNAYKRAGTLSKLSGNIAEYKELRDIICSLYISKPLACNILPWVDRTAEYRAAGKNGDNCDDDSDCLSGNCRNGICCEAGRICCSSDADCGVGEICDLRVGYCLLPHTDKVDKHRGSMEYILFGAMFSVFLLLFIHTILRYLHYRYIVSNKRLHREMGHIIE